MHGISVVVIIRDQPEAHKAAMFALKNQDFEGKWELLVCDNGSKLPIKEIHNDQSFIKPDNVAHIYCDPAAHNVSGTRNAGIRAAKYPFVLCLDGDIVPFPNLVREHFERQSARPAVYGGIRYWRNIDTDWIAQHHVSAAYNRLSQLGISGDPKARKREAGEHAYQSAAALENPWKACLGFQLSFPKSSESFFCEKLRGWGFEDTEFTLRHHLKGIVPVIFSPDLECYHLDNDIRSYNPFRVDDPNPNAAQNILRNSVYMADHFRAHADINHFVYALDRVKYEPTSDNWHIVSAAERDPENRDRKLAEARIWLGKKQLMDWIAP